MRGPDDPPAVEYKIVANLRGLRAPVVQSRTPPQSAPRFSGGYIDVPGGRGGEIREGNVWPRETSLRLLNCGGS